MDGGAGGSDGTVAAPSAAWLPPIVLRLLMWDLSDGEQQDHMHWAVGGAVSGSAAARHAPAWQQQPPWAAARTAPSSPPLRSHSGQLQPCCKRSATLLLPEASDRMTLPAAKACAGVRCTLGDPCPGSRPPGSPRLWSQDTCRRRPHEVPCQPCLLQPLVLRPPLALVYRLPPPLRLRCLLL